MPRRLFDLSAAEPPLLDLVRYARLGPARRDRLSPEKVQHIARTVGRTLEVMVKVLSRGGHGVGEVGCRQIRFKYDEAR